MVSKSGVLGFLGALVVGALLLGVWRAFQQPQDVNISVERASSLNPTDAASLLDPGGVGSRAPNLDVSSQLTDQYQTWLEGATN